MDRSLMSKMIFMRFLLLILFNTLFAGELFSQTFTERVAQAYLQTDKNFDIDCSYSFNKSFKFIGPVSETKKTGNELTREFVIEGHGRKLPMSFLLKRTNRGIEYRITIDQQHISQGPLRKRDFYIAPVKDQVFADEF
jgi:hypothetical protein